MSPRLASLVLLPALVACSTAGEEDANFDELCFGKCDGLSLTEYSSPALLEFNEVVELSPLAGKRGATRYEVPGARSELVDKINRLLTTPIISNQAFKSGARPHRPQHAGLGTTVDVAFWNIERGQQLPAILDVFGAAADPGAREQLYASRIRVESRTGDARAELDKQLDAFANVDVVILNEADRNMKRSGYTDVAAELADKLDMNYTWGLEFIEVDPTMVGTEQFAREDFLDVNATTNQAIDNGTIPEADLMREVREANERMGVDPARAKNLHGNAILSRYPIVSSRLIPLETVCWDWNEGERAAKFFVQEAKEVFAEKLFLEKIMRQIRHGGRHILIADLYVPGLTADGTSMQAVPGARKDTLTVVTAHLEAKSSPECRARQMKEVMSRIADIKNPVVFGGDLNTFGGEGRPTTLESLLMSKITDWQYIARKIIGRLTPYAGWVFTTTDVINWVRLKDDPTGFNLPLLLPNAERGLFDVVEAHTFADGGKFDFRGDKTRTVNGTGKTLANSNQRDDKGFKTTSSLVRALGIGSFTFVGKWKLDWMFARGYQRAGRDTKASYRMAPHFPRSLEELRDATVNPLNGHAERMSDHAPLTLVLPLKDPCREGASCSGDDPGVLEFGDVSWEDTNTIP